MVDIAGSGPVHLLGGASAFAGAIMLGPRHNRYNKPNKPAPQMGNPINACIGLFFLWFGWLAFNSGSTYGLTGYKWEYAARSAFMTMLASFAGGCYALVYSMIKNKGKLDPSDIINGILASLVAITGFWLENLTKIMQFVDFLILQLAAFYFAHGNRYLLAQSVPFSHFSRFRCSTK